VEAIELHDMADTLFHLLDKYKPNLTSNFFALCLKSLYGRFEKVNSNL